ncbi:UV-endonuclease UvdE-domain-containing protein [Thelephora terrestris]|uniref:UV-endonuclease UvdE-domain-containing protein n=1 Tax=Thelephora terrestris TaxID=56493 RepID=A0A9P6L464_9AGAM|nr:UV-endonuclease UvdE-domain-containing protein [Thelephora terrestris]
MLPLSLLRLRVPSTFLFCMPHFARATTGKFEVAPRRSSRTRTVVNYSSQVTIEEHEEPADLGTESPLTDLEPEEMAEPAPKKKRKRTVKVIEPVVYDIPPVETKTATFKGRLGYACLNTILRTAKPNPIFCSRTCRIDTIEKNGLDFAKNLGLQNARDLCKLIQWNEENKIRFLRLSSEMFPFASHAKYGYSLDYAATELKAAGDLANRYGHRITLHPGQFTQIGSPKENVVEASVRELHYHCSMLQYMGMGKDSVMIIHMGGMYGNKAATLERFRENYQMKLTGEIRERLVLENDEMCYSADDLLPVCEELDIPLVFDYHHNWIKPSILPLRELIPRINAIWDRKGIKPKQHLSSPRPGAETIMEKRAHADRCYELPQELPEDMDLMIEAKDKEQAVLHLYRIYQLEEVAHENLRPEKSQETQKLGGKRKSYKLDPDHDEAPGGAEYETKKPRRKKVKKDVIESTELAVAETGHVVETEGDRGNLLLEPNALSPAPDGGAEEQQQMMPARRNRRKKKEPVKDVEFGGSEVSRKGKKPAAGVQASGETDSFQVKKGRKRRKTDS